MKSEIKKIVLGCFTIIFLYGCCFASQTDNTDIYVFKDESFKPLPDYTADDVSKLLKSKNVNFRSIDHKQLETLAAPDIRVIIIPYVRGNFSQKALSNLVKLHGQGTGLLFLGDLPNKDKWYPLRNMQSPLFHLTHAPGSITVEGLTEKGREILGEVPDLDFFAGKRVSGIRTTAFPPDITYSLIKNNSNSESEPEIVAINRKVPKFFGARLAVVGSYGGEPRENVDGAYQMDWTYDPGMLTRDWNGINTLVWKLIQWVKNRPDLAGAIDLTTVHRAGEENTIRIRLGNLSSKDIILKEIRLLEKRNNNTVYSQKDMVIPANRTITLENITGASKFGIYDYKLVAVLNNQTVPLAEATEHVYPEDAAAFKGFGFSTYWAFQEPKISEEYKHLVRQMQKRGSQYVRANIPWEDVEPEPGQYDWRIPEDMLSFADFENFSVFFWMFPTTRGSGLGDGGVPWWSLKEPAIDRYGNKGFHPTLWSPFYRKHYFGMIDAFTKRFANAKSLDRFTLDFGNSDFPYGYYYYVNDPSLFDYSSYEREAFFKYLKQEMNLSLEQVNKIYGKEFSSWENVPVPFIEEKEPWRLYLNFRRWSVKQGMEKVAEICAVNAPDKVAPDPPGHGLGAISDLTASWYDVKARHWNEEKKFDRKYTRLHNAGPLWGGEPWQVGGTYKEYDDALYGSLMYNASYFSIPAPDISFDADGIARVGFIRRSLMGAARKPSDIAVIDKAAWNAFQSNAQVASRMDQNVDLLCHAHRFDFSCYKLLVLPDDELQSSVGTVSPGGSLLPTDEHWYWLLRESVEKGLILLIYPNSCQLGRTPVQLTFLRQVMGLMDVRYGEKKVRKINYPESFGGGSAKGSAVSVHSPGEDILKDSSGEPVLVRRPIGKGAVLLAGWDTSAGSIDGERNYFLQPHINDHSLVRLVKYLGLEPVDVKTGQFNVWKGLISRNGKDYLIVYSHLKKPVKQTFTLKLQKPAKSAYDLATGETFPVKSIGDGWYSLTVTVKTRQGRYFSFFDRE